MVIMVGQRAYDADLGVLDLQQQARLAMDRMTKELRQAKGITVVSASEMTFNIPAATYGDPDIGLITYYLDTTNSRAMREYPSGTLKVMGNDVSGLTFTKSSDVLTIQLDCAKTVNNRDVAFSLRERVRLRNG